jgi:hypothetical protein
MTHVVKLFGDIVAEQTAKGTYVVRKGEQQVSPFEYSEITAAHTKVLGTTASGCGKGGHPVRQRGLVLGNEVRLCAG